MASSIRRQTLADLLRRSARRMADKLAIACAASAGATAEFDAIRDRLAAGLDGIGVARGDKVAGRDQPAEKPERQAAQRELRLAAHAGLFAQT